MNIAVIMGGMSDEHEVSLNSGAKVIENLDTDKYQITEVIIQRTGKWLVDGTALDLPEALRELQNRQIEAAFLALHGPYGEDGRIQGLLEYARIPYTGSTVLGSSLAMDKVMSKKIYQASGIPIARDVMVNHTDDIATSIKEISHTIGYPCVVKPVHLGSSVGVAIVTSEAQAQSALEAVREIHDAVLVEEFIAGDEVTCGVLDQDGKTRALMPTQIIPKSSAWFDYQAKYTPGGSEEVTPPRMAEVVIEEIRRIAVACHHALACSGVSRTDMIVQKRDDGGVGIVVLETNTLPGMTATSLLPQGAAAVGIPFPELLDIIIANALIERGDIE